VVIVITSKMTIFVRILITSCQIVHHVYLTSYVSAYLIRYTHLILDYTNLCHLDYSFDDPPTEDGHYRNQDTPYDHQNTGIDFQLTFCCLFISFARGENLNFQINL